MATLITTPNLRSPDETYARLIAAHDGLNDGASAALNARLILILINHIGDGDRVLDEAIQLAVAAGSKPPGSHTE
jgi:hypothetical protein